MERLIKEQNERGKQLVAEVAKLKREGSTVTRSQLEKHQQAVLLVYNEFYTSDKELMDMEELDRNHPYLVERKEIQRAYDRFIEEYNRYLNPPPVNPPKKEGRGSATKSTMLPSNAVETTEESTITIAPPNLDSLRLSQSYDSVAPPSRVEQKPSSVPINEENQGLLHEQDINMRLLYRRLDTINRDWETGNYSRNYARMKIDQITKELAMIDQQHRALLINTHENEQTAKYFVDDYYGVITRNAEATLLKLHDHLSNETQTTTTAVSMRLPRIEVPIFQGEYEKWPAFKDLFIRVIHKSNLSNIEKMCYLKAHVQRDAAKLISHLPTVEGNYEKGWNILYTRYENKRLLATSYFNTLLSLHHIHQATAANIRSLHDTVIEIIHNIKSLQIENPLEAFLGHLVMKKVDADTLERFETSLKNPREIPSLELCMEFLLRRFQSLEAAGTQKNTTIRAPKTEQTIQQRTVFVGTKNTDERHSIQHTKAKCAYCNEMGHRISQCHHFRNISTKKRIDYINRSRMCTNCLAHSSTVTCKEEPSCTMCSHRHHQLLHESYQPLEKIVSISTSDTNQTTLLATAGVRSATSCGVLIELRALIDQGSQVSLITEEAVQRLGLPLRQTKVKISGIGAHCISPASGLVELCIQPRFSSSYRLKLEAYMLPKITMNVPEQQIKRNSRWNQLVLADPNFNKPAPIDILLGADVYSDFIESQIIKGKPSAIKTSFGWVISGPTQIETGHPLVQVHGGSKIEENMQRFWELEETSEANGQRAIDNTACEDIFKNTTGRDCAGRYVVQLPFKATQLDQLGSSKQRALQRFLQLERKLESDNELKNLYCKFMTEYINLGHMQRAPYHGGKYYLPHHAVIKRTPEVTKIRVVFDASMKTSTGISLNDIMHSGPALQNELWAILLKWRKHRVVFSADIEKMYRQIKMNEEHQRYQTILWRENKHRPIQEYRLTTVTYGTSAAPYLAIRTLHQLTDDEFEHHTEACHILKNDCYVDDILSGADTMEEAQQLQSQLVKLLNKGGMVLGKWSSNHPDLLSSISKEKVLVGDLAFNDEQRRNEAVDRSFTIKMLGIQYSPIGDCFSFHVNLPLNTGRLTKRQFLSEMSRIFDPLGWLVPLIVNCKMMYQTLWSLDVDWDDTLPTEFAEKWNRIKLDLRATQLIQIPRYINYSTDNCTLELHGFCDASEHAYAAVIYSKSTIDGEVKVRLLTAKSKIAPSKTKVTIPRLELCGALLLSKLVRRVIEVLDVDIKDIHLWSDSMITLAWIRKPPSTWNSFVANRVAEIQTNTSTESWRYIRSADNPADCASRGVTAKQLTSMDKWWNGPSFLLDTERNHEDEIFETSEDKKIILLAHHQIPEAEHPILQLINNQSSFKRLIRITVQLMRWRTKHRGVITPQEWEYAVKALVRAVQRSEFKEECCSLERTNVVPKNSKLRPLHPFLDKHCIIRVGGRLQNSQLSYEEQHPMVLPYKGQLTKLILDWSHLATLHGSNALTLAHIRKRYWIIKGTQAVKHHNHQCIRCHRFKINTSKQLMGSLPNPRVTVSRPFTHTGVDYAGPINIRMNKGRGNTSYKGYICIFICLATKAIHIEVASDLSSEGFLSAFRRFIARRGNVAHMYSDNGTNFVGAHKLLQPINWHFIPPASPHFGGLWEAGVKSIKTHLKKCIGDTKLTYEEMTTLLNQIEACLNSRPLCPLTEDPESLDALTPGHFLIGNALVAPPEKEELSGSRNFLSRWKLVQNMRSQFWTRWRTDYLHRLQQRPKWQQAATNLEKGDLVLLHEELQPPTRWKLGRIREVHPGNDGLIRVVTIKTADNPNIKRPITKISPLPTQKEEKDKSEADMEVPELPLRRHQPSRRVKQQSSHAKINSRVFLYTCMMLCMINMVHTKPGIKEINDIQNPVSASIKQWTNSGMYFDKIAKVELVAMKWKLVIRYDLTNYWKEMESVHSGLTLLERVCNNVKPLQCDLLIQQLQWQFNNIKQDNELLIHNEVDHRRLKRGLGDTIGLMAGDMFGILSQREAAQYEHQFEQIQLDEEYTRKLIRNQTSIIDNTLQLFKHSNAITAEHLRQLTVAQRQADLEFTKLKEYRSQQDKSVTLILLAVQLGLVIKHLEDTQMGLIQVLTGAKNHIIHPALLPPKQLEHELSIILKQVSKSVILPGHGHLELHHIYQLMTVKTRVTKSNAIIALEIPLVHSWNYQLYEVISAPIIRDNTHLRIHASTKYILVDQFHEHFAAISSEEKTECIEAFEDLLLCEVPTLHTQRSGHLQCETAMFLHAPVQHESCIVEKTVAKNYFIKLHAPNRWLFGVTDKIAIDLICDTTSYPAALENNGIIILQPGCTLRGNEIHLHAVRNWVSSRDEAFIPAFNISVTANVPEDTSSQYFTMDITTPNLTVLENELRNLEKDEDDTINAHHIHHYVVTHSILWILISLVITIVIRYIYLKRTKQPRSSSSGSRLTSPHPVRRLPACSTEQ